MKKVRERRVEESKKAKRPIIANLKDKFQLLLNQFQCLVLAFHKVQRCSLEFLVIKRSLPYFLYFTLLAHSLSYIPYSTFWHTLLPSTYWIKQSEGRLPHQEFDWLSWVRGTRIRRGINFEIKILRNPPPMNPPSITSSTPCCYIHWGFQSNLNYLNETN